MILLFQCLVVIWLVPHETVAVPAHHIHHITTYHFTVSLYLKSCRAHMSLAITCHLHLWWNDPGSGECMGGGGGGSPIDSRGGGGARSTVTLRIIIAKCCVGRYTPAPLTGLINLRFSDQPRPVLCRCWSR